MRSSRKNKAIKRQQQLSRSKRFSTLTQKMKIGHAIFLDRIYKHKFTTKTKARLEMFITAVLFMLLRMHAHANARTCKCTHIKNLFTLSMRISTDARGKFREHEKCVRVARGAAEGNSSFLSALQTSQVHP